MSGFEISIDWDDDAFQRRLKTVTGGIQDMTPVMKDFAEHMVMETVEHFENEEDPQGNGWQQLSPVTEKLRGKANKWPGQILQMDGILRMSIQNHGAEWGKDSAGVSVGGSNMKYAAIHNFGGMAGRGRKVEIPQRQFLGFNDDDIEYALDSIKDWIITGKVG